MISLRSLLIPVVGLLIVGSTGFAVSSAGASDDPTKPVAVEAPVVVADTTTTTSAAPQTEVAPAATAVVAKPIVKAKATTTTTAAAPVVAPANDVTEIGTACVMNKSADGTISSEGC